MNTPTPTTPAETPPPALERGALVTRSRAGDGTPIYTAWLSGIPVFTTFSRSQAYALANAIAREMQKNEKITPHGGHKSAVFQ